MDADVTKSLFALGGSLVGAVIGAVIKGYFDLKARDRRELSLAITEPNRLALFNPQIASRVELKVDGKLVRALANCEIRIVNTGNRAINDLHVSVALEGEAELVSAEPAGASSSLGGLDIKSSVKTVDIRLPYINPNELLHVRLLTTGHKFSAKPSFRQPDVKFHSRIGNEPDLMTPTLLALYNAVSSQPLLNAMVQLCDTSYRRYVRSGEHLKYLEDSGALSGITGPKGE